MTSDDDRKAFVDAIRDVRPLKPPQRAELTTEKPKPRATQTRAARRALMAESLQPSDLRSAEEIAFRRVDLPEHEFRRLARGEFSIEDEIDLHGMRRDEAQAALRRFIRESVDRYLGCVRVVHGKGSRSGPDGPVLKASVQEWLSQHGDVLAFVSATRRDGGSGAVYVLLRTR
jgi:DNA-nicking Smr family endonuclease